MSLLVCVVLPAPCCSIAGISPPTSSLGYLTRHSANSALLTGLHAIGYKGGVDASQPMRLFSIYELIFYLSKCTVIDQDEAEITKAEMERVLIKALVKLAPLMIRWGRVSIIVW